MSLFLLKNKIFLFITTAFALTPFFAFAQAGDVKCSFVGYTVETINGVFTDERGAQKNKDELKRYLQDTYNNEPVVVDYLLNPSHLAGIGDGLKVVYQKIFENETVQDYDLVEMLKSASEKVKTQKVLLVAHSQGNFYANSFHDKVFGQPGNASANSIAIYSVATPASRVAGGGKWLTSSTDKVISNFVGSVPFKKILPANTNILLGANDEKLGHNFSEIYMKYRSAQIVYDIKASLDSLKTNKNQNENLPCIASPKLTTTHTIEGAVLAVVDPAAEPIVGAVIDTISGVYSAGTAVASTIKNIASTIGSGIRKATDLAFGDSNNGAAVVLATTNDAQIQQIPTEDQKSDNTSVLVSENNTPVTQDAEQIISQPSETESQPQTQEQTNLIETSSLSAAETSPTPIADNIPMPKINFGSGFSPGFGGGGAPAPAPVVTTPSTEQATEEETSETEVSQADPVFISVTSPSDFSRAFAGATIIFSGTSTPRAIISNSYSQATTTSSEVGDWSLTILDFPQGTTTIDFVSSTETATSSPKSVFVAVDTVAPVINIVTSLDCQYSLSVEACILPFENTDLSWETSATDISVFSVVQNDTLLGTTTANSFPVILSAEINNFSVVAEDTAGNRATSTTFSIEKNLSPVVINEISWSGSQSSSADEWIELYNKTTRTIDLSRITLHAEDGAPYLPLSGSIAPNGYYLIERGADNNAILDVSADLSVPFSGIVSGSGLSNSGEVLFLDYIGFATTTLDATPTLSLCGGAWCGGTASTKYQSMERISVNGAGTTTANWSSNNMFTKNGHDSGGVTINGTPKTQNSASSLYQIGYYCDPYTSTFLEGGYYIYDNNVACYYSPGSIPGSKYGDVYRGTPGNATIINGHNFGSYIQFHDSPISPVQGEDLFVAIYQINQSNFASITQFRNFFTTGSSVPYSSNYGILRFKYGVAP